MRLKTGLLALCTTLLTGCASIFGATLPVQSKPLIVDGQPVSASCGLFAERYGTGEPLRAFVPALVSGARDGQALEYQQLRADFDAFLDCYFVDLSKRQPAVPPDPRDPMYREAHEAFDEFKALRAHAILAVLARYAAYNMTGQIGGGLRTTPFEIYDDLPGDASSLLARIERAERVMRQDSMLDIQFRDGRDSQVQFNAEVHQAFPSVRRLNRVFSIVQVAFEAERPTLRRSRNVFQRIGRAITGSTSTSIGDIVGTAMSGLEKAVVLMIYGRAYEFDAQQFFDAIEHRPSIEHWQQIDGLLVEACGRLSRVAGDVIQHCVPVR